MAYSPKNILFVQPSLEGVGGIEKVIPTVASTLAGSGDTVSATVFYNSIPNTQTFWKYKCAITETETKNIFDRIAKIYYRLFFIKQSVEEVDPDVIIVSAQGSALIVLFGKLINLYRVPVVVYVHEGLGVSGKIYEFLIKCIYPLADGFLCVSKGIQDELKKNLKLSDNKTVLAYNALLAPSLEEEEGFYFLSFPKPYFVTASRLEKIKGVDVLVDSFITYAKYHPGTLFIMGTGSLEKELKKRVANEESSNRIIWLGHRNDVLNVVSRCDVYLSCAPSEPFGLSLLEALAAGVPVVATDVPYGPREIMNVNEVETYPKLTSYGGLLSPVAGVSKERWQNDFESTLALVASTLYDKSILKKRAADFSPEKQMMAVKKMINQVMG